MFRICGYTTFSNVYPHVYYTCRVFYKILLSVHGVQRYNILILQFYTMSAFYTMSVFMFVWKPGLRLKYNKNLIKYNITIIILYTSTYTNTKRLEVSDAVRPPRYNPHSNNNNFAKEHITCILHNTCGQCM